MRSLLSALLFTGLLFFTPVSAEESSDDLYVELGLMYSPFEFEDTDHEGEGRSSRVISFIYVAKVACDGPAHRAGVYPGDVITAIDGVYLNRLTRDQYRNIFDSIEVNKEIFLQLARIEPSKDIVTIWVHVIPDIIGDLEFSTECPAQ